MRLALYQPDQPGNVGSILRLGACLGVGVDIILPCGFAFSDRSLRRAQMDYQAGEVRQHPSWNDFGRGIVGRLVLLTTKGGIALPDATFEEDDILLLGSESAGAPPEVHARAALRVRIPQKAGTRSLNIAVTAGIALGEALRQIGGWPE